MIYLDTSVVLARLFAEDRSPPDAFWSQTFVASRLLEYEVFNRIHARAAQATHGAAARQLVDRANLLETSAEVLDRALLRFAQPVRTLDALHLATMVLLRSRGLAPALALALALALATSAWRRRLPARASRSLIVEARRRRLRRDQSGKRSTWVSPLRPK